MTILKTFCCNLYVNNVKKKCVLCVFLFVSSISFCSLFRPLHASSHRQFSSLFVIILMMNYSGFASIVVIFESAFINRILFWSQSIFRKLIPAFKGFTISTSPLRTQQKKSLKEELSAFLYALPGNPSLFDATPLDICRFLVHGNLGTWERMSSCR